MSWEYPPVVIGGLGRHVHHLCEALAAAGHDVVVLTRGPAGADAGAFAGSDEVRAGVRVVAVPEDPPEFTFGEDMAAWTLALGHSLIRAGLRVLHGRDGDGAAQPWQPDVVHAHDWLVAHAAIAVAQVADVPLVSTIHATEAGRHSGWVSSRISRQVHSVEWWLANESDALITCSASMRDEVTRLFGPGLAQIHTIHNGIDTGAWPYRSPERRPGPPRLLFAGRLEYEKGLQDLLAALPRLRRRFAGTTVTVAGEGTQQQWLSDVARTHRILRSVRFVGRLDHAELVAALHDCDALVLPSRYEPFGIVALEAVSAGTPLVASTAGGLGEIVTDGVTGMAFAPADVAGLTAAVTATLTDPDAAATRAQRARQMLTDEFGWSQIAQETIGVYAAAKRRERSPLRRPLIVERPLPERDPNKPVTTTDVDDHPV